MRMTPDLQALISTLRDCVRDDEGGGGQCAAVTQELSLLPEFEGSHTTAGYFVTKEGRIIDDHWWLVLKDGSIFDPTQDQFGEEGFGDIIHVSKRDPRYKHYHTYDSSPGIPVEVLKVADHIAANHRNSRNRMGFAEMVEASGASPSSDAAQQAAPIDGDTLVADEFDDEYTPDEFESLLTSMELDNNGSSTENYPLDGLDEDYGDEEYEQYEPQTFTLPAGTTLYHGTSAEDWDEAEEDFYPPFWVSENEYDVQFFVTWNGQEGQGRIIQFQNTEPLNLILFNDANDISDFEENTGIDTSSPGEWAEDMCARGYDGWIIPGNYQYGGSDIMLCSTNGMQYQSTTIAEDLSFYDLTEDEEFQPRVRTPWLETQEQQQQQTLTRMQLDLIEKYADDLFSKVGIDVALTRHFRQRANDPRNKRPITFAELIRLFKQEYKRYGRAIARLGDGASGVMRDMATDINSPFKLVHDPRSGMIDLVAKTVMRTPDFRVGADQEIFAIEDKTSLGYLEPTAENIERAKQFVWKKWKERSAEMLRAEPTNLDTACKFASMFAHQLFGGDLRGNWDHQFVVIDKKILDLTAGRSKYANKKYYAHDPKFWNNKEHRDSLGSCEPRVNQWVREFLGLLSEASDASLYQPQVTTPKANNGTAPKANVGATPKVKTGTPRNPQDNVPNLVNVHSPAFQTWFGNSLVTTDDGVPLVMFRGTAKRPGADKFGTKRTIPSFVASADIASVYAASYPQSSFGPAFGEEPSPPSFQPGSTVSPVFLSIQNPVDMRGMELVDFEMGLFSMLKSDWSNYDEFEMMLSMLNNLRNREDKGQVFKYELPDLPGYISTSEWIDLIEWLDDAWEKADAEQWSGHNAEQLTAILSEIRVDAYAIVDTSTFTKWARAKGFDGVVHDDVFSQGAKFVPALLGKDRPNGLDEEDMHITWRPFDATQVKSIFNQGGWSKEAGSGMHEDGVAEVDHPEFMPGGDETHGYNGYDPKYDERSTQYNTGHPAP